MAITVTARLSNQRDKRQQTSRHGREGPDMTLNFPIGQGDQNTSHNRLFMHISAATALMDYLHTNSYFSQYAFFIFVEANERCEVRHKFPTRAQLFPSGDNQLCWTHPGQLRRRVEAHHCEPTSTRWPPGYSLPFSSLYVTIFADPFDKGERR
jgi:hypothetical protein